MNSKKLETVKSTKV